MGKRTDYQSYPFFAIRSPLLPLEELENLGEESSVVIEQIRSLWTDPMIRDSLYLASPDFFRELDRHINLHPDSPDLAGLISGFIRYLVRMSSRCTPFGLFAGFGLGRVGTGTRLEREVKEKNRIHLRLDMEYLAAYARRAADHPDRIAVLRYKPNNTLYRIGQQWRYVEVTLPEGHRKSYELIHVENSEVLSTLLDFTKTGKTIQEMISFVTSRGWDEETVRDWLMELIWSQILVSQFEPVVCGINFMDHLSGLLGLLPDGDGLRRGMQQIEAALLSLSTPGELAVNANKLLSELDTLGIQFRENRILQGDMMVDHREVELDQGIVDRVLFGIRIRRALGKQSKSDSLGPFREAFLRRFGDGRIPLLVALDPETGVGLDGSELHYLTDPVRWVDDLKLPGPQGPAIHPDLKGPVINPVFWPLHEDQHYREITREELRHLPLHEGSWPDQLHAMVELTKSASGETIIHLHHCSGGHPAFLMARFAHAAEPETGEWISQLVNDEQLGLQDGVLAEIVHLPEDRTGNVLQRPSFCEYEIPYLAQSLKPEPYQIPVTDLLVQVQNDKVELFSEKSGRRIYPKLTNAHNYNHGKLAVYQFLCKLQEQNHTASFTPDPGPEGAGESFTRGIRFENLILRSPVWKVSVESLSTLYNSQGEPDMAGLNLWRTRYGIPEKTFWIDGDHELFIRWTHPTLVAAAWETIKRYRRIRLRRYPYDEGSMLTRREGERHYQYANQLILAYKRSDLQ